MQIMSQPEILERAKHAYQGLRSCHLCARHCGVNRLEGETGYCGLGGAACCFRELLHDAEESFLNPSHQVYFSGCNLRCEFCSVEEWVRHPNGKEGIDLKRLLSAIALRESQGARTLNLSGGEPTVNLPEILRLLAYVDPETTVVWNSNMYYSDLAGTLLCGLVDITLADLKCGNTTCASHMLGADDYVEVVHGNIVSAVQNSDTVIRCPLIPGHRECCLIPSLEWIAQTVPQARVSLKADYVPPAQARFAPLTYTMPQDYEFAVAYAERFGLDLVI